MTDLPSARDASAGKPTPVRASLSENSQGEGGVIFPSRIWEDGEDRWLVQELGLTRSGRREDTGVLLTLVGFRREREGGNAAADSWEREAWLRHRRLADLSETQLEELFRSSSEFKPVPTERPSFFPGLSDGERRRDRGHRGSRGGRNTSGRGRDGRSGGGRGGPGRTGRDG